MTIWTSIGSIVRDTLGVNYGILGQGTLVTGFFAAVMMIVMGALLLAIGVIAWRAKSNPKWLASFSLGAVSLGLLLHGLIPGAPTIAIVGFIGGIVGIIASVIVYRLHLEGDIHQRMAMITGAAAMLLGIVVLLVELYGGGGFFA